MCRRIAMSSGFGDRPASEIAEHVGCSLPTVKTWRARYERDRLDGLRDMAKTGRPLMFGQDVRARLIALACTRHPARRPRWGALGMRAAQHRSSRARDAVLAEATADAGTSTASRMRSRVCAACQAYAARQDSRQQRRRAKLRAARAGRARCTPIRVLDPRCIACMRSTVGSPTGASS